MKKEIAAKWITALRSGEYQQGRKTLEHSNHFCCLGVLANMASKEGIVQRIPSTRGVNEYYDVAYSSSSNDVISDNYVMLHKSIQEWSGLKSPNGVIWDPVAEDDIKSLVGYNDGAKYSFEQIAELIEQYWEIL